MLCLGKFWGKQEMKLQGRKPVIAASIVALLFACMGMVGLALVPEHGDSEHVAHAASCSGSAVSSPNAGPVGAVIAVCGSGWTSIADGTPVSFGYSTDPNCGSNNMIVQGGQQGTMQQGSYSGWFRWPLNTSLSTYTVCAFIANIAAPPANAYTVLSMSPPRVIINPAQVHSGQTVTVTGSNYLPGGTFVSLTFQPANGGSVQSFGSTVSNSNGSFSISKTLPGNSPGSDTIVANAGPGQQPTLSASAMVTVSNATAPTPSPTATPTMPVTPTPTALPTAMVTATGIAKAPTSVSGTTPVATQNTGSDQTPTAANPPNTTQNTIGGTSAGSGANGQSTFSPLPFALGAVLVLFLLTVLLSVLRTRNKRKRAAEIEKELAPNNAPPWVGDNGLIASYMNNSMNLPPASPIPMNGGQLMPMNGNPASNVPMNGGQLMTAAGVGPITAMGNSGGQEQAVQSTQSLPGGNANGRPTQAVANTPVDMEAGRPGADALLQEKMRQAQMGLYAFARGRSGNEER